MKSGKNQQVIMRLIDAVSDNDKERILSFLADNTEIHTSEEQTAVGQKAIWALVSDIHDEADQIDWQVDQLIEDKSGRVLTQGCLRYLVKGRWCEVPVNGAFEVKGNKIAHWY